MGNANSKRKKNPGTNYSDFSDESKSGRGSTGTSDDDVSDLSRDKSSLFGSSDSDPSDESKSKSWFGLGDKSKGSSESKSDSLFGSDESSSGKKKGWGNFLFGSTSKTDSSDSSGSSSDSSSSSSSGKSGPSIMTIGSRILQGQTVLEKFVFVVLVIIVFVILLSVGSNILGAIMESSDPYIVDGLYTATNGSVVSKPPISRSDNETYGIEFTWSIWINVTSLDDHPSNTSQYKHVFSKGDNVNAPVDYRGIISPNNSPGLYIDKNTNSIVVIMNTFEQIEQMITVTDVPMKKWVNVIIRVEGAYFDVYVNGTLAKRVVLSSVPKQNNGKIYICQNGGFSGFISKLRYYKSALEPGDIIHIANGGPKLSVSSLEKNNLKSAGAENYLAMDWYFHNATS